MFTSNLEIKNAAIIGGVEMPRMTSRLQNIDGGIDLSTWQSVFCSMVCTVGC